MSLPSTREEFKYYCLRKLGFPVTDVNVDEDQVDDRIDEALSYFADYHFDGNEVMYYKAKLEAGNWPDKIHSIDVVEGGTSYANGEVVTITGDGGGGAEGTITTDANGAITAVTLTNNGENYRHIVDYSIATGGGSGANLRINQGGYIELPENILGVVRMFDLSNSLNTNNMFSIQYQIALNDMYTLTGVSMVPYYTTFMHLNLIQQLLIGSQPIRYVRHKNRCYIDMYWDRVKVGDYLILECYEVVDPNIYTNVWKDRWLAKYCAALIKKDYGTNLKKFNNLQLPSGTTFNGQTIYDEAVAEIAQLEQEMIYTYSLPNAIMIG